MPASKAEVCVQAEAAMKSIGVQCDKTPECETEDTLTAPISIRDEMVNTPMQMDICTASLDVSQLQSEIDKGLEKILKKIYTSTSQPSTTQCAGDTFSKDSSSTPNFTPIVPSRETIVLPAPSIEMTYSASKSSILHIVPSEDELRIKESNDTDNSTFWYIQNVIANNI